MIIFSSPNYSEKKMSEAEATGNAAFITASEEVKGFQTKPSDAELLELYALFKQSIYGDNTTAQPSMFSLRAKAKWTAWSDKKGISKEEAQASYIAYVEELKTKQ